MPRTHRHYLPHFVWHLTLRCHQREYLLKFAHDRAHGASGQTNATT
jgi:putative transposase